MSFSYSLDEILETVRMTTEENFDIRTVTLGVNLKDCASDDLRRARKLVREKILAVAPRMVREADKLEAKYAVPIINRRVSVTPIANVLEPTRHADRFVEMARTLDETAQGVGIDFIGGFGALVQKGMTAADRELFEKLPECMAATQRVCSFLNLASTQAGLNMDAVVMAGQTIKRIAEATDKGIGCAKLVCFANAPEDNPFMAGAFHGVGEAEYTINIGISGPGVVRRTVEQNPDCDLTELSEVIKRTVFKITRAGELIGRELARELGIEFGVVDISLAPTVAVGDSVARILEGMGLQCVGAHGTLAAIALLIDAVKKGGAMASGNVGGLSGTFIPVSEDLGMIRAVREGAVDLSKLISFTAVCSVGLDMFAVPGDTPAEVISALIADELCIGMVNHKTTGVRVIPIPGAKAGDHVDYGGLLGDCPVMEVSQLSAAKLLNRGGRIPSPITSMRN
ncbi:MAG: PFL family protein [Planctomycetes bacterium]|nr:PFL family protein [Planctomycetota bacterium]